MNMVRVLLNVDGRESFEQFFDENAILTTEEIAFTRVIKGMSSGKSSVIVSAKMPEGKYVLIELSMSNFEMVAAAFKGAEERSNEMSNDTTPDPDKSH